MEIGSCQLPRLIGRSHSLSASTVVEGGQCRHSLHMCQNGLCPKSNRPNMCWHGDCSAQFSACSAHCRKRHPGQCILGVLKQPASWSFELKMFFNSVPKSIGTWMMALLRDWRFLAYLYFSALAVYWSSTNCNQHYDTSDTDGLG